MQTAFTTKTIMIVLGVLLVAGGGAAVAMKKNNVSTATTTASVAVTASASAEAAPPKAEGGSMSLKDLIASAVSKKCTVTTSNDKSDSSGTVYISNGKMRTDFTSVAKIGTLAGKVMLSHMIVDTDMSYMWGESAMKFGIKIARKDVLDVAPAEGKTPANQAAIDLNEKSEYNCDSWIPDAALFTPPTDITFNDMSAMTKSAPKTLPAVTGTVKANTETTVKAPVTGMSSEQMQAMCGACANAGAGKAACLDRFGCK